MYKLGVLILHWDCHNLSTAVIEESTVIIKTLWRSHFYS